MIKRSNPAVADICVTLVAKGLAAAAAAMAAQLQPTSRCGLGAMQVGCGAACWLSPEPMHEGEHAAVRLRVHSQLAWAIACRCHWHTAHFNVQRGHCRHACMRCDTAWLLAMTVCQKRWRLPACTRVSPANVLSVALVTCLRSTAHNWKYTAVPSAASEDQD